MILFSSINKVIRIVIISDFLFMAGWGFIGPIFAIFLTEQISGGDVRLAGFAAAIYWIVKSILQPFIARYLDKDHGEIDDFYFLAGGYFLVALVPIGYIFTAFPWHIYVLQAVYGIGMACVVPTWAGIFTRHIDKGRENFEWSIESTSIGFAAGITGAVGGLVASLVGFKLLFLGVSFFTIGAGVILFLVFKDMFPRDKKAIRPLPDVKEIVSPK